MSKPSTPTVVDLGWTVARVNVYRSTHHLCLMVPADSDEHVSIPAQSVTIVGEASIRALRDFLLEWYPLESKP